MYIDLGCDIGNGLNGETISTQVCNTEIHIQNGLVLTEEINCESFNSTYSVYGSFFPCINRLYIQSCFRGSLQRLRKLTSFYIKHNEEWM